jgi:plasmid stabilization system protein ParE
MTGCAFHPEAEADINDIWEYIAADNSAAANRVTDEIEKALNNLVPFPGRGHRRPDLTSRPPALHSGRRIPDCIRAR